MKKKSLLGSRKALTLVELVVTLALFAVVTAITATVLSLVVRGNQSAGDNFSAQTTAQMAMEKIETELRYANAVTIDTQPVAHLSGTSYIEGGGPSLAFYGGSSRTAVYPVSGTMSVSAAFRVSSAKTIHASVTVAKKGKNLCTLETDIYLNNLPASGVLGAQQGSVLEYTKP